MDINFDPTNREEIVYESEPVNNYLTGQFDQDYYNISHYAPFEEPKHHNFQSASPFIISTGMVKGQKINFREYIHEEEERPPIDSDD